VAELVAAYPMSLAIDYPDRKLSKLTTFFRLFTVLPIPVVLALLEGFASLPTVLILLFRKKYPRWWLDWNIALTRFSTRVSAYLGLLRDEYPSADEEQAVHIDIPYPDAKQGLNRWLPLVKWFLASPTLHCPLLPRSSCRGVRSDCLVCHPVYQPLPEVFI